LLCGNVTVDCGDYVVVSNASKVKVSGLKEKQLVYRKHSMYPGGLKETPYERMMATKPWEVRLCCYPRIHTHFCSFTE
jgi:large subunit ribosomal protein L13